MGTLPVVDTVVGGKYIEVGGGINIYIYVCSEYAINSVKWNY